MGDNATPDAGSPGDEGPPAGEQPAQPKPPEAKGEAKDDKDPVELQAALGEERKHRRELQTKLDRLEREHMSEQEKAIATAKAEGRAEAIMSAGKRLAAAEFRAAAAGRISDANAALEVLDLSKFVGEDGEPDTKAIAGVVERLAAALPAPTPPATGRVSPGPRGDADNGDFIRSALGRQQ